MFTGGQFTLSFRGRTQRVIFHIASNLPHSELDRSTAYSAPLKCGRQKHHRRQSAIKASFDNIQHAGTQQYLGKNQAVPSQEHDDLAETLSRPS